MKFHIIINSFSVIAVILACMGLFGLISRNTDRLIKEIGVRKVFGATVNSIVFIMIRDLLKWVVLANFIAFPLAWFFMNKWLQNFAYHTEMRLYVYAFRGNCIVDCICNSKDGIKIFHPEDIIFEWDNDLLDKFKIGDEKIDIVFVPYFDLAEVSKKYINKVINPKQIIAMHFPLKDFET